MVARKRTVWGVGALLLLMPAALPAQDDDREEDVLVRVNGAAIVPAGDTVSTVVSVGDSARIEGVVEHQLVLVRGDGLVAGTIEGDVVVVNSRLELAPGARIAGDVRLVNSQLARAPDAVIAGRIEETTGFGYGIPRAVMWVAYLGVSVFVLIVGALLAILAGRPISEAAALAFSRPGPTAVAALIPLALPAIAVAAMFTVIGIPLGVAIFALLLPALWLAGYVVFGAAIGAPVLRGLRGRERLDQPVGSVLIGLLILQLLWLVPFVGMILALLAGLWGAGALIYRSWDRRRRGEPPAREEEWRRAA